MLLQLLEPGGGDQSSINNSFEKAIGIDLGTTHSLVAVATSEGVMTFTDAVGRVLHPSVVSYTQEGAVTGYGAINDVEALSSFKRRMGYDTSSLNASCEVLKSLKHRAEKYLGHPVRKAVITVPAYFDEPARVMTRDAARLAGLEVLRLVNEPTAAALAYGLEKSVEGLYAIYDLGGGTFDVSLLRLEGEIFQVLATAGDIQLGGDTFDDIVAYHLAQERQRPHEAPFLRKEARALREALSFQESVSLSVTYDNRTTLHTLTRVQLESLMDPVLNRTFHILEKVFQDAGVNVHDLQGLVLVGGVTRTPKIVEKMTQFLGKPPLQDIDPDQVVVWGAALQAKGLCSGSGPLLMDVTPLSLGLEMMGGIVEKIIPRNSPVPVSKKQEFTTYQEGQTAMMFHVVQGERELVSGCRSLTRFQLQDLPSQSAGSVRVEVAFTLDVDGLLTVTAQEKSQGLPVHVEIKPNLGLVPQDFERILLENVQYAKDDMHARLLIEAKIDAKRLLKTCMQALQEDGFLLDTSDRLEIQSTMQALEEAVNAGNREEIMIKTEHLQTVTVSFAAKRMTHHVSKSLQGERLWDVETKIGLKS